MKNMIKKALFGALLLTGASVFAKGESYGWVEEFSNQYKNPVSLQNPDDTHGGNTIIYDAQCQEGDTKATKQNIRVGCAPFAFLPDKNLKVTFNNYVVPWESKGQGRNAIYLTVYTADGAQKYYLQDNDGTLYLWKNSLNGVEYWKYDKHDKVIKIRLTVQENGEPSVDVIDVSNRK